MARGFIRPPRGVQQPTKEHSARSSSTRRARPIRTPSELAAHQVQREAHEALPVHQRHRQVARAPALQVELRQVEVHVGVAQHVVRVRASDKIVTDFDVQPARAAQWVAKQAHTHPSALR